MQVRPGHATSGADQSEHFASLDALTHLHIDTTQVAVHGGQAMAVIDEHGVAVEKEVADFGDDAIGWRL